MDSAQILQLDGIWPDVVESAWVAPGARLIGDVHIDEDASVWYGAILRADLECIHIGSRTSIQDNCVVHVESDAPVTVGEECTIGHAAVLHGCTIGHNCLVGINATILTGASIGAGSIVGAGAVVPHGSNYAPRSLLLGVPAKRVGEVSKKQTHRVARGVAAYVQLAAAHREAVKRTL